MHKETNGDNLFYNQI